MASQHPLPKLPSAPLWRRLAALIYDSILITAILLFIGFLNLLTQLLFYGEKQLHYMTTQGYTLDSAPLYIACTLAIFAFFCFFWRRSGQTPGMQAWRIRLVNESPHAISFSQATLRWLVAIPSIALCFIGILWVKIDKQQKNWPDKLSNTKTVLLSK